MKKCNKCKEIKELDQFRKCLRSRGCLESICISCKNKYQDIYRKNNPDNTKNWRKLNPDYQNNYDFLNKEKKKENMRLWKINNPEYHNNWQKEKKKDPLFKLISTTRSLVLFSLKNKGYKKNTKTELILGCTFQEFKNHLESKFEPWMNWDNRGNPKDGILEINKTWNIDHIIPLNSTNIKEEIIKLNHYTNLQPLCSYVNRFIKRDNLDS